MAEYTEQEITQLQNLVNQFKNNPNDDKNWNWLDGTNPSQAFLICLGAGPWKIKRREVIQQQAVLALGNNDLSQIEDISIFKFPLKWQNDKVQNLINYLNRYKISMEWWVDFISNMNNPVEMLYEATRTSGRAKVLDLFARDYLKVQSFPIDRWVKKILLDNNFPVNEKYMIGLCRVAGLNPRVISKLIVNNSGFTGNSKIKL